MIGQVCSKKTHWGFQISLLLSMFAVAQSHAATDAKPNPRGEGLLEQVVTVATRQPADALSVNGSISNISDDQLRLVGHAHVQQSLNRAAGVNLNRGNGQEYLPAIRSPVLTGAGGCGGFLMTEDGIPLRAAGFCNINELFEAHTEAAERLEILRGSGTALYGSNAMHGVINVVTPSVTAPDRLGFDLGEHGFARMRFSLAGGEQHKFAVRGTLARDDGYRDDAGYGQQKLSLRHAYAGEAFDIESGLTLVNLNQETAGYITGLDAYKSRPVAESNPNPEAFRDARSARLWSKINLPVEGGEWQFTPYARYTTMDFLQHFLPGKPLEENGQKSFGMQLSYFSVGHPTLDLIAGVDAEYTEAYLRQTQANPTTGSAFLRATIPVGKHYDYRVDATQIAPFMQIKWMLADDFSLTFGGRYEMARYDYSNRMLSGRSRDDGTFCGFGGCRYSRPMSAVNSYENRSLDLAAHYQTTSNQHLYVRLASAFRAPQATELYRLQRGQQIADLDPEKVDSLEIGIKEQRDALSFGLAIYGMRKENVIFRDSGYNNVSNGETEHRGVELEVSYSLTDNLQMSLNGTYAEHKYANNPALLKDGDGNLVPIDGNDVDSAPRGFGSVRALWKPSPQGRLELEWVRMGSYYLEPRNAYRYAGHNLFNVRGSWDLKPNVTVYVRLLNATDRDYAKRADYTSFTDERYFPGTPRSFGLGVDYVW